MPVRISYPVIKALDTWVPQETTADFATAMAAYGLTAYSSQTIAADTSWTTVTASPITGSAMVCLKSTTTGHRAVYVISRNALTSQANRISSLSGSGAHLECAWVSAGIQIRFDTNIGSSYVISIRIITA